jgi:protein O-GlcNAc transferase
MSDENKKEYYDEIKKIISLFGVSAFEEIATKIDVLNKTYPEQAEVYFILGLLSYQFNDPGRAASLMERAHALQPDCRDYADTLATVYTRIGKLAEGLYFAKLSTALQPHPVISPMVPDQLANYFNALRDTVPSDNFVEASRHFNVRSFANVVRLCGIELRINSHHADCYQLLGRAQHELGEYEQAVAAFHAVIHLRPGKAINRVYLGGSLLRLGRFAEARECFSTALAMDPDSTEAFVGAVAGSTFLSDPLWRTNMDLRSDWVARREATQPAMDPFPSLESADQRIRVGYLSNRFYEGTDMAFVEAVLQLHDRSRFEVICYQQSVNSDLVTQRLKSFSESWREVYELDDLTLSSVVQGDDVDILVDLCGYSENQRLDLLAAKPAKVAVSWLGLPAGLGVPGIDVVISDPVSVEADRAAASADQACVVLEQGLVAVDPLAMMPDVVELPAAGVGIVTFGGFCDLGHVTPEVAAVWSRILHATPGSRLLLGYRAVTSNLVMTALKELFSHHGVSDRVHFQDTPDSTEALDMKAAFFERIEVFLDTFPVCGTDMLCEALWMGIPVLSLAGERRSALMGASILRSAGKEEWIARSKDDLVQKAVALVADLPALAKIRAALRDDVADSPLFDAVSFVRALEGIYETLLEGRKG